MKKRLRILAVAVGWCLSALLPAFAAGDKVVTEYDLKAAYLYKFTSYTDWPDAKSPSQMHTVNICVAGDDPFGSALDAIKNASTPQMTFNILRNVSDAQVKSCHILFVSTTAANRVSSILAQARTNAVLTVSEISGFADQGGIIEMVKVQKNIGLFSKDRINLRINMKMARQEELHIDAQLLAIAAEVIQ